MKDVIIDSNPDAKAFRDVDEFKCLGVRVYPYSPGILALQIRSKSKLFDTGKSSYGVYSHASLNLRAAKELRDALDVWIKENERSL